MQLPVMPSLSQISISCGLVQCCATFSYLRDTQLNNDLWGHTTKFCLTRRGWKTI